MIPALILTAAVVLVASARGRAVLDLQQRKQQQQTTVGTYTPNSQQLQQQAAAAGDVWTGSFDMLGDVTVRTEAEFMQVGDSFDGMGQNMTENDSRLLLELMFWATAPARQWGTP